jgi:hypothetical protein
LQFTIIVPAKEKHLCMLNTQRTSGHFSGTLKSETLSTSAFVTPPKR